MAIFPRVPRLPRGRAGLLAAIVVIPLVAAWFALKLLYAVGLWGTEWAAQSMLKSTNARTQSRGEALLRNRQVIASGLVAATIGASAMFSAAGESGPAQPVAPALQNEPEATSAPIASPSPATKPSVSPNPRPSPTQRQPASAAPSVSASQPAATMGAAERRARKQLAALKTSERINPRATYERAAFGSSWVDTDGNGCNQRDDVLERDAVPGTLRTGWQGRCDHDVLGGTWIDPYTSRRIVLTDAKERSQSMAVQIDHVVPLSEAWVSGADQWSPERRRLFANDLNELLAVDGPTNASKGDHDPAAWRPRKGFQCTYAIRWIAIKDQWDLTVDDSEVQALKQMLDYC